MRAQYIALFSNSDIILRAGGKVSKTFLAFAKAFNVLALDRA